jgi:hypothetical protein
MLDIDNNILQNKKYIFKIDYIGAGKDQKKSTKDKQGDSSKSGSSTSDNQKNSTTEKNSTTSKSTPKEKPNKNNFYEKILFKNKKSQPQKIDYITINPVLNDNNNQTNTNSLPKDVSIDEINPNMPIMHKINQISFYKNRFCKFTLFKELIRNFNNFQDSIIFYIEKVKNLEYNDFENLRNYSRPEEKKNSQSLDPKKIYRFKYSDISNTINEIEKIQNEVEEDKKKKKMFHKDISKLLEEEYNFYLYIFLNLLKENNPFDENVSFLRNIKNIITSNFVKNGNITDSLDLEFIKIKVFESTIFLYKSIKEINNLYMYDRNKLIEELNNLMIDEENHYNRLRVDFITKFRDVEQILLDNQIPSPPLHLNTNLLKKSYLLNNYFMKFFALDLNRKFKYVKFIDSYYPRAQGKNFIGKINNPQKEHNIKIKNELNETPEKYIYFTNINTGSPKNKYKDLDLYKIKVRDQNLSPTAYKEKSVFLKHFFFKNFFNENYDGSNNLIENFLDLKYDIIKKIFDFSNFPVEDFPIYNITDCDSDNFYFKYFDGTYFSKITFHFNTPEKNRFHIKKWNTDNDMMIEYKIHILERDKKFQIYQKISTPSPSVQSSPSVPPNQSGKYSAFSQSSQSSPSVPPNQSGQSSPPNPVNYQYIEINDLNNIDPALYKILGIIENIMFNKHEYNNDNFNIKYYFDRDIKLKVNDNHYGIINEDGEKRYVSTIDGDNFSFYDFLKNKTNY